MIEPGLLRLFRWFVAIRLAILLALRLAGTEPSPGDLLFVTGPGILLQTVLLGYLYAGPLHRRLSSWYLPVALWLATVTPAIENAANVNARLAEGVTANEAIADYWLYFFYLFVPLIMIAWQYRYRWVVLFSVGTLLLDAALVASPLESTGADVAALGGLMAARSLLFAVVGLVLVKLVSAQRSEREAQAEGALTRERLAMSEERRRLARELHDTLAHTLSAVAVQLEGATTVWDDDIAKAKQMVEASLASTRDGLIEARRAIEALRSSSLDDQDLVEALGELARTVSTSSSVRVQFSATGPGPSSPDSQHVIYRVASEALTNVVRHAAASRASLTLNGDADAWQLTVEDNGKGFDRAQVSDASHGLTGMSERARSIDAHLDIESNGGNGTRLTLVKTGR